MRCDVRNCLSNEDGYCMDSSYVSIDENGECSQMEITEAEEEHSELKPCPFCGSTPEIKMDDRYPRPKCDRIDAYEVVCTNWNCIIGGVDDHYYRSPEEASEAWNRRANDV